MNVSEDNKNNNLRSEYKGQNYYFCSDKCRQEFDRNPANFSREAENKDRNQEQRNKPENRQEDRQENRDDRRPR
jgi:YHS domain-containing protein